MPARPCVVVVDSSSARGAEELASALRGRGFEVLGAYGSVAEAARALAALPPGTPPPAHRARRRLSLSEREREVLALLARGHAYADAARALGVGLSTVQSHVRNIYRKLEVSSKAEAAVIGLRLGLIS